jgi:hypothetical protein
MNNTLTLSHLVPIGSAVYTPAAAVTVPGSQELASRGATLLMVCRSEERGSEAVAAVQAKTGNKDVHLKVSTATMKHK